MSAATGVAVADRRTGGQTWLNSARALEGQGAPGSESHSPGAGDAGADKIDCMALPDQLRPYFPSYELADLDCGADKKLIITSLLNFGDNAALRWLFSMYVLSDITDAVQHPLRGSWTRRALNFWRIIFDLDPDEATMARALAEPTPRPDSYKPLFD